MYYIDVLQVASFAALLGWLAYSLVDSVQRNDTRALTLGLEVAAGIVVLILVLVVLNAVPLQR